MHYSCLNSFWSVALLLLSLLSFLVRFKNATQKFRVSIQVFGTFWHAMIELTLSASTIVILTRCTERSEDWIESQLTICKADLQGQICNDLCQRGLFWLDWNWVRGKFDRSRVRFDSWRPGGKGGFIRPCSADTRD